MAIGVQARGDDTVQRRAEALAASFGTTVLAVDAPVEGFVLDVSAEGVELRRAASRAERGVRVDFRRLDVRRARSRRQPLGRAIGREARSVVDATAGLGQDSVILACMGCAVTAIERSPVVAALLADGLERARRTPALAAVLDRIDLVVGDAAALLPALAPAPDVVYLDPMFPPKRRASALPPKAIQYLRDLVGPDDDAADLLVAARAVARRRVVVKRPTHAPPLARCDFSIAANLVRYDVHVRVP